MIKAISALRTWLLLAMIEPTDVEITIRLRSPRDAARFKDAMKKEFHPVIFGDNTLEEFKLFGFRAYVRSEPWADF